LTNHKKVIILPSPPAPQWSFFDFVYLSGSKPISDWYENETSDRGRLSFDALLKNNQKIPNHLEWGGFEKYMKGRLKGHQIWQWKIPGEVQYRMLGVFDGPKRTVFLMGYYHKGGVYTPPDALETALKRKKLLERRECTLNERKIKIDQ
jgi:hypothetical protein